MAGIDLDPKVLIVGLLVGGYIYMQSLGTGAGLLRSAGGAVRTGARGVYGDVKGTARTGYRDVAKPIGRAAKTTAKGVSKRARGLGRWLKRRVS